MLLAMTGFVRIWFADALANGMATLAGGMVVYLVWLSIREKRQQRREKCINQVNWYFFHKEEFDFGVLIN